MDAAKIRSSPRIVATVRALLREGREHAQTGADLLAQVRVIGIPCDCQRRIQEAIRHLRVVEHMQIASAAEGYWIETDLDRLALTLVSHKRRVRASAEAIRVYDPILADRLTLALELSEAA